MRRASGASDDHLNPAPGGLAREIGRAIRRTMRRGNVDLVSDPKLLQCLPGLAHNLKVGIASHHDGNQGLAHQSPLNYFFSARVAMSFRQSPPSKRTLSHPSSPPSPPP